MNSNKDSGNASSKPRSKGSRAWLVLRIVLFMLLIASPFLAYRLGSGYRKVHVAVRGRQYSDVVHVGVSKVIDADTIEVYLNSSRERVQLLGIDGPEVWTKEVKTSEGRVEGEWVRSEDPLAWEARDKLSKFLEGKKLTLEFEREGDKVDRYGRLLAWLWAEEEDGSRTLVNEWLLREGICTLRERGERLKYSKELREASEM